MIYLIEHKHNMLSQAMRVVQNAILVTAAIFPALFLHGCHRNHHHHYVCHGKMVYGREQDNNKKCDICVRDYTDDDDVHHHTEHVVQCYEDINWVAGGLLIFFLVLTLIVVVWFFVTGRNKKSKSSRDTVYRDEENPPSPREKKPLLVTTPGGSSKSSYTVEELRAQNQRDLDRQLDIDRRLQERNSVINLLHKESQSGSSASSRSSRSSRHSRDMADLHLHLRALKSDDSIGASPRHNNGSNAHNNAIDDAFRRSASGSPSSASRSVSSASHRSSSEEPVGSESSESSAEGVRFQEPIIVPRVHGPDNHTIKF